MDLNYVHTVMFCNVLREYSIHHISPVALLNGIEFTRDTIQ